MSSVNDLIESMLMFSNVTLQIYINQYNITWCNWKLKLNTVINVHVAPTTIQ